MAKQPVGRNTTLDEWAIAAGSTLGRLVAKIDKLTARRAEISAEIQHYVRQAEGALRKAVSQEAAPKARKRAATKRPARKTRAKARQRASRP
jgi:hypothetical protein